MTTGIQQSGSCCPISLGEVCWNNGAGGSGRAFAIYDPIAGTTTYQDIATGGAVPQGQIVSCNDDTTVAVNGVAAHSVATANGNVAAGKQSVTITNIGSAAGTVLGAAIQPGETMTWTAYYNPVTRQYVRIPQIAYAASATAILSIVTLG